MIMINIVKTFRVRLRYKIPKDFTTKMYVKIILGLEKAHLESNQGTPS